VRYIGNTPEDDLLDALVALVEAGSRSNQIWSGKERPARSGFEFANSDQLGVRLTKGVEFIEENGGGPWRASAQAPNELISRPRTATPVQSRSNPRR
jgi:hypothetical protein